MRQIGATVGNGNNSAVQYHFGTKDRLVRAIFEYRLPGLRQRRALLIDERRPTDLRGWLECQIRALFEQSELDGSHYMSFIASLLNGGAAAFGSLPPELAEGGFELRERLGTFMEHVGEPLRGHRLNQAMTFVVQAAAARERARDRGEPLLPFALEVISLVDGISNFLQSPVSPEAQRVLDDIARGMY